MEMSRASAMKALDLKGPSYTEKQLSKAYRRLALKWHPDKNGNCQEARLRFQTIQSAYALLQEWVEAGDDAFPQHARDLFTDDFLAFLTAHCHVHTLEVVRILEALGRGTEGEGARQALYSKYAGYYALLLQRRRSHAQASDSQHAGSAGAPGSSSSAGKPAASESRGGSGGRASSEQGSATGGAGAAGRRREDAYRAAYWQQHYRDTYYDLPDDGDAASTCSDDSAAGADGSSMRQRHGQEEDDALLCTRRLRAAQHATRVHQRLKAFGGLAVKVLLAHAALVILTSAF